VGDAAAPDLVRCRAIRALGEIEADPRAKDFRAEIAHVRPAIAHLSLRSQIESLREQPAPAAKAPIVRRPSLPSKSGQQPPARIARRGSALQFNRRMRSRDSGSFL
jgi:hypothetical protein